RGWSSPSRSPPATSRPTSPTCCVNSSRVSRKMSTPRITRAITIWRSPTKRWASSMRRSRNFKGSRQSCQSAAYVRGAGPMLHGAGPVQARVVGARPRAEREGKRGPAGRRAVSAGPRCRSARTRRRGAGLLSTGIRAGHSIPRHRRTNERSRTSGSMSGAVARVRLPASDTLREIQAPVRQRLDTVVDEMRRIVTDDLPIIREVSSHLLQMRGKMFRPTLALLASAATGTPEARATTLAAIVELMHLATLVHDDSVDHSVLRRGLPTVNSLFSHQVSVIMGDFLY